MAEPIDAELHDVTFVQKPHGRVPGGDACRRARRDHVAGTQSHEVADVAHQHRHVEDQVTRGPVLLQLVIHCSDSLRTWTSAISSFVAMKGPIAANLSQL